MLLGGWVIGREEGGREGEGRISWVWRWGFLDWAFIFLSNCFCRNGCWGSHTLEL